MIDVSDVKTCREGLKNAVKSGQNVAWLTLKAAKGVFSSYDFSGKKTLVLCGGGSNGGYGFALCLLLAEKGVDVTACVTKSGVGEEGVYFFNKIKERKVNYFNYDTESDLNGYDVIVDAILGGRFSGKIRPEVKQIITKVNLTDSFVISVDMPSGLDGDNGIGKTCIKADLTVCLNSLKPGYFLNDGKDACGKVTVADLGYTNSDAKCSLIEIKDVKEIFPPRKNNSHKAIFGRVALIGGSRNYSGAVKLANLAISSLKVGAGLTRLAVPSSIWQAVAPFITESTLFVLSDRGGRIKFKIKEFEQLLSGVKSVAFGIGAGGGKENEKIVKYLLS